MTEPIDLLAKLDELAGKMLDDAQKEDVMLATRLDVFKFVSQHCVSIAKVKPKGSGADGNGQTMDDLRNGVATAKGDGDEQA